MAGAGIHVVQGSRVKERDYLVGVPHEFDVAQEIVGAALARERETTALVCGSPGRAGWTQAWRGSYVGENNRD